MYNSILIFPSSVQAPCISLETFSAVANVLDPAELKAAIDQLSIQAGGFDVVHYNAAIVKSKDILEETAEVLVKEFTIDAAHALLALQATYSSLKEKHGALLLTGGGLGVTPHTAWGSLSIGKAALRSLALQLHDRLKEEGIYVGLLTIDGLINPQSPTHNPATLADLFWQLYSERSVVEIHHSETAPAAVRS